MKTEFLKIDPEDFSEEALDLPARLIAGGKLVAFPTETVYGLGASALDDAAVKRIYEAKGRPSFNPLIIHIASPGEADRYAVTDGRYRALAEAFMPGPLTVVMPYRGGVAPSVTAGLSTIAVRCPVHPVARALIRRAGVPIAAPSANLSGKPSTTTADHVLHDLGGKIPCIIDGGPASVGLESTIVKLSPDGENLLLRPGGITLEMLRGVLGEVAVSDAVLHPPAPGARPESPGMLLKHYAPDAPLYLVRSDKREKVDLFLKKAAQDRENAVLCFAGSVPPAPNVYYLGNAEKEEEEAKNLFALLRLSDRDGIRRIYAPLPDAAGIGLALQNRMLRAAAFRIKEI